MTPPTANDVRAICFYLPQFHPIPENDEWWGKGFTEWTNVAKARPLFPGHYQPHVPADLGFYDLRLPETRVAQAELARAHGVHGFCYWHYWFNGRRVLNRPFDEVLASGEPDFPFCLAWANENWTRRWDGKDHEVLLQQVYSDDDDATHIRSLLPALKDRRYITVDGKPLLLIYRVNYLPDPARTARIWQDEAKKAGLKGLYLCSVTGWESDVLNPHSIGLDAAVGFQPQWKHLPGTEPAPRNTLAGKLVKRLATEGREAYWHHNIRNYETVAKAAMSQPDPEFKCFRCVTPGWDNSPRRSHGAHIFKGSDPQIYRRWLDHVVQHCRASFAGDERLVFINAWNEWAEGNHLEPDLKWGRKYLEETRLALAPGGSDADKTG